MSFGRSERLIGRQRELAVLRGWLAQAGGGRGGPWLDQPQQIAVLIRDHLASTAEHRSPVSGVRAC